MPTWLPFLLAFISACVVTYYRLYTSDKFHNFYFLVSGNRMVVYQAVINAIVAILLLLFLKDKVVTITKDATTIGNYIYPLLIGAMAKGVSDIKLFDIKTDGFSFPLGLRTITQPLDKYFEEKLDGICFPKTKQYLKLYSAEYNKKFVEAYHDDMDELKDHVISQLELYHRDRKKVTTFKQSRDFKAAKTPDELLVLVLQEFGRTVFESVFPL